MLLIFRVLKVNWSRFIQFSLRFLVFFDDVYWFPNYSTFERVFSSQIRFRTEILLWNEGKFLVLSLCSNIFHKKFDTMCANRNMRKYFIEKWSLNSHIDTKYLKYWSLPDEIDLHRTTHINSLLRKVFSPIFITSSQLTIN